MIYPCAYVLASILAYFVAAMSTCKDGYDTGSSVSPEAFSPPTSMLLTILSDEDCSIYC